MAIITTPEPQMGKTDAETIRNLYSNVCMLRRELDHFIKFIDSDNVTEINTNITRVKSDKGTTEIKGPQLIMKDLTPIIRLQAGLDAETGKFVFKLMDSAGKATLSMSDLGQILLSGKPLFLMYDDAGTLRLKMGYDPETGKFVFEMYNIAGAKTIGQNDNGDAKYTGEIEGGTISGSKIKGSSFENDSGTGRIEIGKEEGTNIADLSFWVDTLVGVPLFQVYNNISSAILKAIGIEFLSSTGDTTFPLGTWECGAANFKNLSDGNFLYATRDWAAQKGVNTASNSHKHTVMVNGVTYETSEESHSHSQT